MVEEIAAGIPLMLKSVILGEINGLGVKIYTGMRLEKVVGNEITTVDRFDKRTKFNVDHVVMVTGFAPNLQLREMFKDTCNEVYVVGDWKTPRFIF
jgi:NADPH-dependent 2,4-dienoyl-CoA reductase/sulfur reductase-like enzyme